MKDFKSFVKEKRTELGYSQNKLAKLIGITQSYFNGIERGEVKNPPSDAVLDKIAEALNLSEEETRDMKYMAAMERTPDIIKKELFQMEEKIKLLENSNHCTLVYYHYYVTKPNNYKDYYRSLLLSAVSKFFHT